MSHKPHRDERIGVLLLNLGGPETLDDVRPFLYNLFSDPDIIRLPFRFLQKPLARLISSRRHKKSSGYYEQIGGGSPLRRITNEQARALEAELQKRGTDARTYVAMRYWHPFTEEALEQVKRDGITRLVVLPLYPQFSVSTTGSSLNRLNEIFRKGEGNGIATPQTSVICTWHDDPEYIHSLVESVKEELAKLPDQNPAHTHLLFSAHSVPVKYIEAGDPYLEHTKESVRLVMEGIGTPYPQSLSFQSKVGPVKWLEPSTDAAIRRIAAEGSTQLLLIPISFVSEHIETLYELDILYRDVAEEVGIRQYARLPALNCRPGFIAALANLVEKELRAENQETKPVCPIYSLPCQQAIECRTNTEK
jgi:protoporphyrin/coproporphyrin ferrochelatase